ncbi:hypothetical protein QBC32DRAFT_354921 [Pseudoneurospora amorphoporcata]|uniref:Secreted protein n=1 Tax=Pseudoneurospora amorphoporcata TaxID=241081 RepID=A0AAN6SAP1_9PEZI|nr:hypothetical protein QBC32DRAFT_354921 [Pseudoneurospora amorphoporcata]
MHLRCSISLPVVCFFFPPLSSSDSPFFSRLSAGSIPNAQPPTTQYPVPVLFESRFLPSKRWARQATAIATLQP